MNCYAIIPARGGSKGVPGKNIQKLGGYPLIAYSIIAAKLSTKIDRIIVSTDSEEIAEISKLYGAEVPFMRPSELATDHSQDIDFVIHAIDWFKENDKSMPKYLAHLRPTTPLRDPEQIDDAISLFQNSPTHSLRSAHKATESPYKWFRKENSLFKSFIEEVSLSDINKPRQQFQDAYIPDGYIDVLKTSTVIEQNDIHGTEIFAYESPPCHEVDTKEDFEYLTFELSQKNNKVYDYLKTHF